MTIYKLTDGTTDFAEIKSNPFRVSLTEAGKASGVLSAFEEAGFESPRGKLQETRELSLSESWVSPSKAEREQLLRRVAKTQGWGIVPQATRD